MKDFHPNAAQYLEDIPPQLWVTAFYPSPYYGHKTSNVVESTNKVFKNIRELPIMNLLDSIWHYVMKQRFERFTKASTCISSFTPWCYTELLNSKKWSTSNTVQASSPTSAIITQTNKKTFVVDLISRSCTCGHFQANTIPCGHAFSFISYLQSCFSNASTPGDYISNFFSLLSWQQTYASNISPISSTDISSTVQISAPTKERKPQGRPKVKRFTVGDQRKKRRAQAKLDNTMAALEKGEGSQACTQCGDYGHNRRSCKGEKII